MKSHLNYKRKFILIIFAFVLMPFCFALSESSIIVSEYEQEINLVLNSYPELENVTILFIQKEISHTMQSKPKLNFIFLKKQNHEYKIILNNGTKTSSGILVKNLTFNQRVGILAHELGHVVDYETMNDLGIMFFGIQYLFPNFKRKIEHRIDKIAINHGFGKQLIDFSNLAFYGENIPEKYKKKKFKYYYTPEELERLQKEYELNN